MCGTVTNRLIQAAVVVVVVAVKSCHTLLDFDSAVRDGRFRDLTGYATPNIFFNLSYDDVNSKSMAFKLDTGAFGFSDGGDLNVTATFAIAEKDCQGQFGEHYNLELSLTIVKLYYFAGSSGAPNGNHSLVEVGVIDDVNADEEVFSRLGEKDPYHEHYRPNVHLFRTWKLFDGGTGDLPYTDPFSKRIRIALAKWHEHSSVYFLVTLHKRMRSSLDSCPNYPDSDFSCELTDFHELCIGYDLVCDDLPNCAQQYVNNPDEESCYVGWNFNNALQILIYVLIAVAALLILIGVIRFCHFRFRARPSNGLRLDPDAVEHGRSRLRFPRNWSVPQRFGDILTGSLPRRPRNAPPTYDDATKNDNQGFVGDEAAPPPAYDEGIVIAEDGTAEENVNVIVQHGGVRQEQRPEEPPPYTNNASVLHNQTNGADTDGYDCRHLSDQRLHSNSVLPTISIPDPPRRPEVGGDPLQSIQSSEEDGSRRHSSRDGGSTEVLSGARVQDDQVSTSSQRSSCSGGDFDQDKESPRGQSKADVSHIDNPPPTSSETESDRL